jgi:hypothetical protein
LRKSRNSAKKNGRGESGYFVVLWAFLRGVLKKQVVCAWCFAGKSVVDGW